MSPIVTVRQAVRISVVAFDENNFLDVLLVQSATCNRDVNQNRFVQNQVKSIKC